MFSFYMVYLISSICSVLYDKIYHVDHCILEPTYFKASNLNWCWHSPPFPISVVICSEQNICLLCWLFFCNPIHFLWNSFFAWHSRDTLASKVPFSLSRDSIISVPFMTLSTYHFFVVVFDYQTNLALVLERHISGAVTDTLNFYYGQQLDNWNRWNRPL